ncbi:ABC transporter [Intrasporangium chromatireducens Q5-1]|uniref:ABC transporter n=1 Tax=Intrasporangium chromatireducens Q5-1 TaxID=584657 RepID=W9GR58_9MICO|nr:thiol reductant ABC exporter subunit CydD [Intrasporangium chromatireducens]EWT07517.1 ABC transporter [Intrasporangium chromatireducens Q5-1]
MKPFDPRLLRTVPAVRAPIAALTAVGVLSGALTVATAFALSALVVAVVEGAPVGTPALWLAALFAARALLAAGSDIVSAWAGAAVSTRLRSALLRAWGRLPAERRPDPDTAVTLATSGATAVEPYAARYLPTLLTAALVPGLAIATLAVVDWPSAVIVVLTLPLLPVFAVLIGKATQTSTERRWVALAQLSGHFLDVVRGLPTLVGYGRAGHQVGVVKEVSERHRSATMATLRIAFLSSAALELLASISVAIVAVVVGLRLSWGTMSLGAGLVAILLSPEAYWPIRRVGAEFHSAAGGAVALDAILAHLEAPNAACEGALSGAPVRSTPNAALVEVEGVEYRYAAELAPVLRDLTLRLAPGLTVVTGPSGVGKSTLLELLAGLRTPTRGTVTAPAAHLVTQRPFIPAGTVRAAVTLGAPRPIPSIDVSASPMSRGMTSTRDEAVWEALRRVGLDGVVAALPGSLDAPLGDDGFGLSAGQRQRIALARASLCTEPLVLLDEPTAHLDGDAAEQAHALIAELAERRVVVAVTHRPELLRLADHHVHLEPVHGPATELRAEVRR